MAEVVVDSSNVHFVQSALCSREGDSSAQQSLPTARRADHFVNHLLALQMHSFRLRLRRRLCKVRVKFRAAATMLIVRPFSIVACDGALNWPPKGRLCLPCALSRLISTATCFTCCSGLLSLRCATTKRPPLRHKQVTKRAPSQISSLF